MKPETIIINGAIGTSGTLIAALSVESLAAIFAGVATGLWMLWQIGVSIWDRRKARQRGPVHFPPS